MNEGACRKCDGTGRIWVWRAGDPKLAYRPETCPDCNEPPNYGNPDNIDLEKEREKHADKENDRDIDY